MLIGEPHQKVICPKACHLTCSIPASWDAYNQILLDKLQRHSILPKLHAIFTESASPGFDWNTLGPCLEALDSIKSQCMQYAEKKCRKLQMGQVPFSPELMQYYFLQQLWLLVWRKRAGHPVSSSKIRRLSKKCSLPQAPSATLLEAEANYRASSLHYQQLKPLAAELRSDFLHRRTLEPQHSDMHLKAVTNILRNERRCESYQAIRHLKGVSPLANVSQVETTSPAGPLLHTSQAAVEHQIGAAFS